MSVTFKIADQVLRMTNAGSSARDIASKYDAFLNLACENRLYQKDAVFRVIEFLVSANYPSTERLALENFNSRPELALRYESRDAFLERLPLKAFKAVSIDLATGTGKSYVIYALAAIALAEGLVDRVLVLCPSLTIEDGLREKFRSLIGTQELTRIMQELGAKIATPGLRTGNDTIDVGDICVENIHAVYDRTGSSITDSFGAGKGARTLVINDEAHHIFSQTDSGTRKWLRFLRNPDFGFSFIVNLTGTPYVGDDYFPDVVYRYGLRQAIEDGVVKKPDYKLEESLTQHSWDVTHAIHEKNRREYGHALKPITIVVTADIARCVEVWRELVNYLAKKEGIAPANAEKRCIWVTSGIPSGKDKERIEIACPPRTGKTKDSPERRRVENLELLREVDDRSSPVEWIVSVSMLTEGWDVKNVFQIVPHESRAFESKLLISQVLGRGLRVPPKLDKRPLVAINNHEKWSTRITELLKEVLEVDNVLGWQFVPGREDFVFPLHNLKYEPIQTTTERKAQRATAPVFTPKPQAKTTRESAKFSETGSLVVDVSHEDGVSIDMAVKLMKVFLNEKDATLAEQWTNKSLRTFISEALTKNGQDPTFLSRQNLSLLQQCFGPQFRVLDAEHPRISQQADALFQVDVVSKTGHQTVTESSLKDHGHIYFIESVIKSGFETEELALWEQYQRYRKLAELGGDEVKEEVRIIASKLHPVEKSALKIPWNLHVANFEPERLFTDQLLLNADLIHAWLKLPNQGVYSFPYSYKPANAARTHVAHKQFNPDVFIRLLNSHCIVVVEIKHEEDRDQNRNAAKYRDGKKHFELLNAALKEAKHKWRYIFKFLSPVDFTKFFQLVRAGDRDELEKWKSSLMVELE